MKAPKLTKQHRKMKMLKIVKSDKQFCLKLLNRVNVFG